MTLRELIEQAKKWQEKNPNVDVMEFDITYVSDEICKEIKALNVYSDVMEIELK